MGSRVLSPHLLPCLLQLLLPCLLLQLLPCLLLQLLLLPCPASPYSYRDCDIHNSSGVLKVFCYNHNLSSIPAGLPRDASELDVSGNRLWQVTRADLAQLPSLRVLNATRNEVRRVERDAFAGLGLLSDLNLAHNRLGGALPHGLLGQGLVALQYLRLDYNRITSISATAFSDLPSLVSVNLSGNSLTSLDAATLPFASCCPILRDLLLADNLLPSLIVGGGARPSPLPPSPLPPSLRLLDVSGNPLALVNFTDASARNLSALLLHRCLARPRVVLVPLTDPQRLGGLRLLGLGHGTAAAIEGMAVGFMQSLSGVDLHAVELDGNAMGTWLTAAVVAKLCTAFPGLRLLSLRGNGLTRLGNGTFKGCSRLCLVDLQSNGMEEVERWALGGLPALREVYLGANSLSTFPASAFAPPPSAPGLTAASVLIGGGSDNAVGDVGSCDAANADVSVRSGGSGVTTLDLGSNSISVLQAGDLQWLLELNTLNLSKNQITEVSSGFLRGPRRLRRLLMSANRLMSVAGIFPEDLGLLEALDLRSNYLSKLPAGNFANLTSLLLLNVADNQIAEAEDGAFDGLAALVRLDLGGNKLGLRPLGPRAFEGLVNLTNLEFNNNYLHYASAGAVRSPPFTPLRSLTHLFLNSQRKDGMVNFPSNFLQGLATLQELHAGQLYLSALDAGTFLPTPNLRYLDLGSNPLCGVEPALLRPVPLLDELHLRGVRLDDVTFLSRLNLSLLRVLRVSNNRIGEVSAADLGALPRLQLLDIVGNPLSCGCDNEWLRDFLLNSSHVQAPGLWRVHCGFPLSRRGELFVRFDASQCRNRSGPLLFACCSCAVALVMLAATVFRFWRWHLLYGYHLLAAWFGEHKRRTRPPGGPIRYDAFVSYNSDDEEWVMRQLLPQLEGAGMRLCLHHRDFVPGKDIVENIMDGIYASRRTLCIVTRSYLRSEWCSKELQVAAFRLFEENQDVLVLLFLERIPHNELSAYLRMRRTIRSRTYITWPGARGDSFARRGRRGRSVAPAGSEGACKLFWHRVVSALGPEDEGHGVAEEEGPLGAPLVHAC